MREKIEAISEKVQKLGAIQNAIAAMALTIHTQGSEAYSVLGESTEFIENLAYLKDLKDTITKEIFDVIATLE